MPESPDHPVRVNMAIQETTFEFHGVRVATDFGRGDVVLPRIGETVVLPSGDRYRVEDVVHDFGDGVRRVAVILR